MSKMNPGILNPAHTQIISWKNQKHETKIGKYMQIETQKEEYYKLEGVQENQTLSLMKRPTRQRNRHGRDGMVQRGVQ